MACALLRHTPTPTPPAPRRRLTHRLQAAQEAFATGQAALGKEMQATARAHADAASSARRRANVSAFRRGPCCPPLPCCLSQAFLAPALAQHAPQQLTPNSCCPTAPRCIPASGRILRPLPLLHLPLPSLSPAPPSPPSPFLLPCPSFTSLSLPSPLPACLPACLHPCLPPSLPPSLPASLPCRSTNAAVMNSFTLDLHGQHVDEALQSLERWGGLLAAYRP